jgi:hypothetical protein
MHSENEAYSLAFALEQYVALGRTHPLSPNPHPSLGLSGMSHEYH